MFHLLLLHKDYKRGLRLLVLRTNIPLHNYKKCLSLNLHQISSVASTELTKEMTVSHPLNVLLRVLQTMLFGFCKKVII